MRTIVNCLVLCAVVGFGPMAWGDDWPQWMGPQRDGVWRETGIIDAIPPSGPKVLWRVPVAPGYTGPAIAGGRVYLMDRIAQRKPPSGRNAAPPRPQTAGVERVLCLNETDGSQIWKDEYPVDYHIAYNAGPRATPVVHDSKVYTFGAQSDVRCYAADSGKLIWNARVSDDPSKTPTWGYSASPLIDGQKLICLGSGENIVIAYDKDDGHVLWKALSGREPGYCSPVIYEAGGARQLIIFHPAALVSLDPETGKTYWSQSFEAKAGLTVAMPRKDGDLLFVSCFYNGAMVMKFAADRPAATMLWKRMGRSERNTDALHTIFATPWVKDGLIFGTDSYGELRGLELKTGNRLWETMAATVPDKTRWSSAFIIPNGERYFLFNETGDLILADLSAKGYREIGRAHLLEPTNTDPGRPVVWSHPAFANKSVFWRNDKELIRVAMGKE